MTALFRSITSLALTALLTGSLTAINWPVTPFDESHPIGNSYGEFQGYGGQPYMHPGIDVMAPAGTPVYAVKAGYVKAVLTTSEDLHWRVAIGDSAGAAECNGWLYAHLDLATITVNEGEYVEEGQYLGDIVEWSIADFHHLHFVKIRNSGIRWNSDWAFVANPLDELEILHDRDAPVFEDALPGQKFAFLRNESPDYFALGAPLDGDVDVVCRVYDYINDYRWKVAPYRLEFRIRGHSSLPWVNSVCFTGVLDFTQNIEVVYQLYGDLESRGDYEVREFYFNVTNTDGDSVIEATDRLYCWQTADFRNGPYTIYVRAFDRTGNSTIDSMQVYVGNFFVLSGTIYPGEYEPDIAGTVVTSLTSGMGDTTDQSGHFEVIGVGGGWQEIEVCRPGYELVDTIIMMNQDHQLELTLWPNYLAGDANFDGTVNMADVVYLINCVFHEGQPPIPYLAGDTNSDESVDIGDAVFLLNYIFRQGPPPVVFLKVEPLVHEDG